MPLLVSEIIESASYAAPSVTRSFGSIWNDMIAISLWVASLIILLSSRTTVSMERPISELLQRHGVIIHTSPESTVQHAVSIMAEHDIGSVLVFRNNTELLGIFTERDLLHRVVNAGLDPTTTPLREVMTEDVVVVSADTPRGDVIDLMREEQFRHVPIAQDGQLVGVVSLRDVLRFENRQQAFEIEQLREYVLEKPYPTYPG